MFAGAFAVAGHRAADRARPRADHLRLAGLSGRPGPAAGWRRPDRARPPRPRRPRRQFSAAVAGTPWRIVVTAPQSKLYGLPQWPGRWIAWLGAGRPRRGGPRPIILVARLARQRTRLTELNGELARLAAVDPLTGLRNRRAIEEYLHDALSAARRHAAAAVAAPRRRRSLQDLQRPPRPPQSATPCSPTRRGSSTGRCGPRTRSAAGAGRSSWSSCPAPTRRARCAPPSASATALAADQPEVARAHGLPVTVTIGVAEWRTRRWRAGQPRRWRAVRGQGGRSRHGARLAECDGRCRLGSWRARLTQTRPPVPGRRSLRPISRPAKSAAPSANLLITRERRWSDCLKVLAGPWRCPAAKSGG